MADVGGARRRAQGMLGPEQLSTPYEKVLARDVLALADALEEAELREARLRGALRMWEEGVPAYKIPSLAFLTAEDAQGEAAS